MKVPSILVLTIINSRAVPLHHRERIGQAVVAGSSQRCERSRSTTPSADVALIDLRMPLMDGIARCLDSYAAPVRRLSHLTPTCDAEVYRHSIRRIGSLKDMLGREVVQSIRAAAAGKRTIPAAVASRLAEFTPRDDLTAREVEVLQFVAKGLRNKEIARVIGRTEGTVKMHLKHVMAKLGVDDRTEAVTLGAQRGIIHLDG